MTKAPKTSKKYVEIYNKIKSDLVSGSIAFGKKLPSKREAAELFKVSVITVEHAYGILESEGYIEARERSGYYSCYSFKEDFTRPDFLPESISAATAIGGEINLSGALNSNNAANSNGENGAYNHLRTRANFNLSESFPFGVYASAVRSTLNDYGELIMQKTPTSGSAKLKSAIKGYLKTYRGIDVCDNQIVIGSGAEYLYGIIIRLIGQNKGYALEKPSYSSIKKVYEQNGIIPEELALGQDGILSDELKRCHAKVLHVTPYRSYPTGITASASKRAEYLRFATDRGGYVIEDDYQSEFSLSARLTETLYGECENGRVIYVNTFSKTLFPAVRAAYMLLPLSLVQKYERLFGELSCTVPTLEQLVIAKLIENGSFVRHLNRVRRARRK